MYAAFKFPRPQKNTEKAIQWKAYRRAANEARRRALERIYGSLGAASPVRKIDPVIGKIIAIIKVSGTKFAGKLFVIADCREFRLPG